MIDAKYGTTLHLQGHSFKQYKGPWTYIAKQATHIHENIDHVIGNGASSSFWIDKWIGETPLKTSFPRIYALSNKKDASIAQSWNLDYEAWDLGLSVILMTKRLMNGLFSLPSLFPRMTPRWKRNGYGIWISPVTLPRNPHPSILHLVVMIKILSFTNIFGGGPYSQEDSFLPMGGQPQQH